MSKGRFISIEGIEGAGKSTAMVFVQKYLQQYLQQYLQHQRIEVLWTREPGGTALAEAIRQWLLHPPGSEVITSEAELLLLFAARAQHLQQVILPALRAGKWVVSDRFIDASYAYQGGGREMNVQHIALLDHWIVGTSRPDMTLLLDVSPDVGTARTIQRGNKQDRIESEKKDFFMRVRAAYLERARAEPKRIKIIDANQSLPAVEEQIEVVLTAFLKEASS